MSSFLFLRTLLEARLEPKPLKWFRESLNEVAHGANDARLAALISIASRHVRGRMLEPTEKDLRSAQQLVEGWNPERWSLLEAVRVALVLSRPDLAEESGAIAVEDAFRYADEGELCALYRCLALLPQPERFVDRAREGCRTNMRSVFEAVALDTPYPVRYFDDDAWRQAVVKCVFIGAPLWRMWGLDTRLSDELARMALDLVDERRSAGRPIQPELWLCLGQHGGRRALKAIETELQTENASLEGRRAALLALARAGETKRLAKMKKTIDPALADTLEAALDGRASQAEFRALATTL